MQFLPPSRAIAHFGSANCPAAYQGLKIITSLALRFPDFQRQNFAFNVLMDPEIDFVTLLGTAGTGKTLLALAAGLTQTMDDKLYHEIVMTRETVPVGEDIGFLPGTEEEKMAPWMGALIDNLELLGKQEEDAGSRYFCESSFWASQPKQAAKT